MGIGGLHQEKSLPGVRQDWGKEHFQLSDISNLGFLWVEESRILVSHIRALGRYFCGCISMQGFGRHPLFSP